MLLQRIQSCGSHKLVCCVGLFNLWLVDLTFRHFLNARFFYLVGYFLESQRPSENLSVEIQKGFKRLMGIIFPQNTSVLLFYSKLSN